MALRERPHTSWNPLLGWGGARRYRADFDSTSSQLYALGRCLHGRPFPGAGIAPSLPRLVGVVNALPARAREQLYRLAEWWEALPPGRIEEIDEEEIGATHGRAMHLAAALGVPWLPQTFLLALGRRLDPDDLAADMPRGRELARRLLIRNPNLVVFQMHDPVHDRLMLSYMAYFRIKRRSLGPTYRAFMERVLQPGALIVIVDCRLQRRVTRLDRGHTYQAGGLGATTPDEYLHGGPRVARFLQEQGPPRGHGRRRRRTRSRPRPSGATSRIWTTTSWRSRGSGGTRYAASSSTSQQISAPARPISTGPGLRGGDCRPIASSWRTSRWSRRGTSCRARRCCTGCRSTPKPGDAEPERFVDTRGPFDEISLMLLSNGVDAIGLVSIARWKQILARAWRGGCLLGVDERAFPRDFASFVRHHTDLEARVPVRSPAPPLSIDVFEELMHEVASDDRVRWQEHAA